MKSEPAAIERILFPTDFSPFAAQALRHALALAQKFKARLKVVYVIPQMLRLSDSAYTAEPWLITPEARRQVEQDMREFLQPLREARLDHEVEIGEGEPWQEILTMAHQMSADLVVMGTHGRSGLERLFLGSVAEKLIRRLPCPVLTVSHEEGRTWEAPGLVTRILCATDFSETSTLALDLALALNEAYSAEITVVHVVESFPDFGDPRYPSLPALGNLREDYERKAEERLQGVLASAGESGRVRGLVVSGRAYKEILRLAATERADLIVIGAQGHGALEHLLSGSNAQHIIRRATCPVLSVRPRPVRERAEKTHPGGLTLAAPADHTSEKENQP